MKHGTGFTLIEMAIVLIIITILVGGLATPLAAQIQARRIAETKKILEEARDALYGYAMSHPTGTGSLYLPCPDTDGDGRENRVSATQCTAYRGTYPWADLGTAAQDAWGNRLRYAVVSNFINSSTGFTATTPSPGNFDPLQVCTDRTCTPPIIADQVVFVVVSHGPNGWGAQNVNGSTLAPPTALDEADNLDSDRSYVSRPPAKPDNPLGEFDDLLTWASHAQLIARVCPTGCVTP
ncbi:MAG: prepilin-type N-terminal cleavage/methylation domain-containing protein [Thiobacillus sp.]|nr:prepilin-type N-terminal cleavage/methylation domain-containing protein [Thiobacillus sp.]